MKNQDIDRTKILKCYHCGNETLMQIVGESKWTSNEIEASDLNFSYKYELFSCPICRNVTLREIYSDETMINYNFSGDICYYSESNILYPICSIEGNSIPPKIKDSYEAALKTKNIDKHICLMALRRTLEMILIDKGATKWGLKDKIEEIAAKGLLPESLKEASSLTKILGDSAAHAKDLDIGQFDVESISEFIEYLLEYLYILPDKITKYKRRYDKMISIK